MDTYYFEIRVMPAADLCYIQLCIKNLCALVQTKVHLTIFSSGQAQMIGTNT